MGNVKFLCQDRGSLCIEMGLVFLPTGGFRTGTKSSHRADKRGLASNVSYEHSPPNSIMYRQIYDMFSGQPELRVRDTAKPVTSSHLPLALSTFVDASRYISFSS